MPTAFVKSGAANADTSAAVSISRGTAVVLLICYGAYLFFQLYTHKYLYTLEASKFNARGAFETSDIQGGIIGPEKGQRVFRVPSILRKGGDKQRDGESSPTEVTGSEETAAAGGSPLGDEKQRDGLHKKTDGDVRLEEAKKEMEADDEEEEPQLKVWIALVLLVIVTVITGVTAEFLVSSIDGMTTKSGVNKEFVALILLPLVGEYCIFKGVNRGL